MKFGHFDDERREYVIDTPFTPLPWINYLGNEDFFSIISNTAGGYSFFRDAALRRITRFRYNNVPSNAGGHYFYVNDGGAIWSPSFMPVKTPLDRYSCRHGLGYTTITGARADITLEVTYLVPAGARAEVQRVRVTNTGAVKRSLSIFSFVEFALWNAQDDAANFQRNLSTGEVEIEHDDRRTVVYHLTEYRERRNHFAFYAANVRAAAFDSDRESFLGPFGGFSDPRAVLERRCTNSVADGWSPIASHQIDLSLDAGESHDLVFVLGYAENEHARKWDASGSVNKQNAKELMARFETSPAVDDALSELRDAWSELLSHFHIQSGDARLDRMVNIWNQYQCMATYNVGRSASYFESGVGRGLGFRDTSQDLLGFVHLIPERARERILDVAATQFEDGGCYHQYQPLTKRGNNAIGSNFNDDPLWLIAAVAAYLKETGDFRILDLPVPFDNDETRSATLFEHLSRSFDHVLNNLGPHGLPLIGRADWNDCLNLNCYSLQPDESFQTTENREGRVAESVLIAGMFCYIGRDYVDIAERHGLPKEAARARESVRAMEQAVIEHGWDGSWFIRAYDGEGRKVGSHECTEGKIFIETQGFCSMAQIGADRGYPARSLDSVATHLDTKYGIVLQQPAYTRYYPELGEISSYPPGYKENAGIFCHNNPWIMIAEAVAGRADAAFDHYRKIAPAYIEEISEIHRTEPYVYAQMVAGKDARRHGEAKNSWLTGTAAWNFVAITQHILGVRPGYDGLIVDPRLPGEIHEVRVERRFRGAHYDITIRRIPGARTQRQRGDIAPHAIRIDVDGKEISGTTVPAAPAGARVQVLVQVGAP